MAKMDTITLTAAQVHPIFGLFSLAITPHIPPYDANSFMWEDAAQTACKEHGDDVPLDTTPAEAWLVINIVRVAITAGALSPADTQIGCYLLDRLEDEMDDADPDVHRAIDVLAMLDWCADYIEENCSNGETVLAVLRRARWDANRLMPEHACIIDKRPKFHGPTVGEIDAVERAFVKVGLSKEQAYEAVGYTPPGSK